jgi:two-component system chemotaxis response regulator CheB
LVVVQHIAVGFTKALARRLEEAGHLASEEASDGSEVLEGRIYVAPAGRHLELTGAPGALRIRLQDDPPRLGVRPSADIMMASVARILGPRCLGVVLTGMGKDGTEGLRRIRDAGGRTFAQDEGSCVVFGMPRSAAEAGVVGETAPPALLAQRVARVVS